jgi:hypothetical protein
MTLSAIIISGLHCISTTVQSAELSPLCGCVNVQYCGRSVCVAVHMVMIAIPLSERPSRLRAVAGTVRAACPGSRQSAVPQLYRYDDLKYCAILQLQSELHKLWTVYSPVKLQGFIVCG